MNGKFALLLVGAVLSAQPPANIEKSTDFEASVRAAMRPAMIEQRAAAQKQASSFAEPGGRSVSGSADASFFTLPLPPVEANAVDRDPLSEEQLNQLVDADAGAEGLMQLMPATAEELDVEDSFDPRQNAEAGARMLKSLLERYQNDPALALSAYNAGTERVDQDGSAPPLPEATDFLTKIFEKLRSLAGSQSGQDGSVSNATAASNSGWQTPAPSLKDF